MRPGLLDQQRIGGRSPGSTPASLRSLPGANRNRIIIDIALFFCLKHHTPVTAKAYFGNAIRDPRRTSLPRPRDGADRIDQSQLGLRFAAKQSALRLLKRRVVFISANLQQSSPVAHIFQFQLHSDFIRRQRTHIQTKRNKVIVR